MVVTPSAHFILHVTNGYQERSTPLADGAGVGGIYASSERDWSIKVVCVFGVVESRKETTVKANITEDFYLRFRIHKKNEKSKPENI